MILHLSLPSPPIRPIRDDGLRISESRGPKGQAQVEAALQNDRSQREIMEAGLSRLVQQLRHNAQTIQQTLMDERDSGVKISTALQFFIKQGGEKTSLCHRRLNSIFFSPTSVLC